MPEVNIQMPVPEVIFTDKGNQKFNMLPGARISDSRYNRVKMSEDRVLENSHSCGGRGAEREGIQEEMEFPERWEWFPYLLPLFQCYPLTSQEVCGGGGHLPSPRNAPR